MATTRLSEHDRNVTVDSLKDVIANIVRFVDCPIKKGGPILHLWNNKFPRELVEARKTVQKYNIAVGGVSDMMRFAVPLGGDRVLTARLRMTELVEIDGLDVPLELKLLKANPELCRNVIVPQEGQVNHNYYAMPVTPDEIKHALGNDEGAAYLEWMQQSADLYTEITDAGRVLDDLFGMIKTAGQVKRMVPDLLQYLPVAQRAAFEDQKRASTVPFEWAPYDKSAVERMLVTLSKGHLLAGMAKPHRTQYRFQHLDSITWGRYGQWAT